MRNLIASLMAAALLFLASCEKPVEEKPKPKAQSTPAPKVNPPPQQAQKPAQQQQVTTTTSGVATGGIGGGGGGGAAMAVRRGSEITNVKGHFYNIGLFYHQYVAENGKVPGNAQAFLQYIQRDHPQAAQKIQDGTYVFNPNAETNQNAVLCYEKNPYGDGTRVVMMGDKSIKTTSATDFQQLIGRR